MTSIKEFRKYLKATGIYSLSKMADDFKKINPEEKDPQKFRYEKARWQGLNLALSNFLNTLYFEMLDFKIGLEQEVKKTKWEGGKVILNDLQTKMDLVLALREEVLATGSFTNRELFSLNQQKFLLKIINLRKVLRNYLEELQPFEQSLLMN
ncbi:MAG: hypothetical protein AABY40_00445 [Nanoarchaeota archaeon]